jgi:transcriptional regulator with XRE-family HTH domain
MVLTFMTTTLGERIRELRSENDLSLREFAEKLGGLSAAFLSDIELGRRHPSDKILAGMAQILKVPLEDLRKYDRRAPLEELKRLATTNPAYGLALRQIVEKRISPEALMKLVEKETGSGKKTKP